MSIVTQYHYLSRPPGEDLPSYTVNSVVPIDMSETPMLVGYYGLESRREKMSALIASSHNRGRYFHRITVKVDVGDVPLARLKPHELQLTRFINFSMLSKAACDLIEDIIGQDIPRDAGRSRYLTPEMVYDLKQSDAFRHVAAFAFVCVPEPRRTEAMQYADLQLCAVFDAADITEVVNHDLSNGAPFQLVLPETLPNHSM